MFAIIWSVYIMQLQMLCWISSTWHTGLLFYWLRKPKFHSISKHFFLVAIPKCCHSYTCVSVFSIELFLDFWFWLLLTFYLTLIPLQDSEERIPFTEKLQQKRQVWLKISLLFHYTFHLSFDKKCVFYCMLKMGSFNNKLSASNT